MSMPGIGRLTLQGNNQRYFSTVQGTVLTAGLCCMVEVPGAGIRLAATGTILDDAPVRAQGDRGTLGQDRDSDGGRFRHANADGLDNATFSHQWVANDGTCECPLRWTP